MCERCPLVFRNLEHKPYVINKIPGELFTISKKTEFRGYSWFDLGAYGRRKAETALMIAHLPAKTYFHYV